MVQGKNNGTLLKGDQGMVLVSISVEDNTGSVCNKGANSAKAKPAPCKTIKATAAERQKEIARVKEMCKMSEKYRLIKTAEGQYDKALRCTLKGEEKRLAAVAHSFDKKYLKYLQNGGDPIDFAALKKNWNL